MPPAPGSAHSPPGRLVSLGRGLRLRCPHCGTGALFRSWFRMHDHCGPCGLVFAREPGFYLGSIYINYGGTVLVTGAAYALLVLGLGLPARTALGACLALAVGLPPLFFPFARSLLLALDAGVNHQQARSADRTALDEAGLRSLGADDGRAGCALGVALALVLLFGLGMGAVTLMVVARPPAELEPLE